MKLKLLIILNVFLSTYSCGQRIFDQIKLEFSHSLRIPNGTIIIEVVCSTEEDNTYMHVQSTPLNNDPNWMQTKVDTTISITKEEFNELKNIVYSISLEDVKKSMTGMGTDGTMCRLVYGDIVNKVVFEVWSPDYNTEVRGLEKYLQACELMLKMAGFNPRKIF